MKIGKYRVQDIIDLLHRKPKLRNVSVVADAIDEAVRWNV